jgi:hypothetical protein
MAFYELEKKLAVSGITTMYHSLTLSDEWGVRNIDMVTEVIKSINRLKRTRSMINHKIHLRYELTFLAGVSTLEGLIRDKNIDFMSYMDHTPGQGQFKDAELLKDFTIQQHGKKQQEVDLHVHTKISDNSLSASEVIRLAKGKKITHLAITDHDTTKGLQEAIVLGQEIGVGIVPGIEISAYDYQRNNRAHILGLFIEPEHPSLDLLCTSLVQARNQASFEMVREVIAAGYDISWEDVQRYEGGTGVYKQHIMHALPDKGYCEKIYCNLYKKLFRRGSSSEAQGIAYIQLEYIDAQAAILAVKEAGGIAVLAHPGQFNNFDAIDEWMELGLEGIEVFHPSHNEDNRQASLRFAQKHHLIMTGGSDFHGFYGEKLVELGCLELGEECIDELLSRKKGRGYRE